MYPPEDHPFVPALPRPRRARRQTNASPRSKAKVHEFSERFAMIEHLEARQTGGESSEPGLTR